MKSQRMWITFLIGQRHGTKEAFVIWHLSFIIALIASYFHIMRCVNVPKLSNCLKDFEKFTLRIPRARTLF